MVTVREALAKSALFKGLSDAELDQVLPLCHEKSYTAGFSIISEGDAAKSLYVIVEGSVVVETSLSARPGMVQDALVEILPSDEPFGWSSIVGIKVHAVTVRSVGATKVLDIDGEQLLSLLNGSPAIGFRVMEGLVEVMQARIKGMVRAAFP